MAPPAPAAAVMEVFRAFLKLGLTSFGGPVAHLGYFREEFVVRRRWLDDTSYADLVALCQFLPGPASSQVGFAIGLGRGGIRGALAAFLAFTLPSALLLVAFAARAHTLDGPTGQAVIHGLKLVAVAVVAHAVWGMARTLTPDVARASIALAALALVTLAGGAAAQVGAIALGAVAGLLLCGNGAPRAVEHVPVRVSRTAGVVALAAFALLLVGLPLLAVATNAPAIALFDAFYRAGALVFGGGHVVLPLLEAQVVSAGWTTSDVFLAGYGAAQAVPGPLFSVAAYLGAVSSPLPPPLLGAAVALSAIFLPGFLILVGVLPFWTALRVVPAAQAALRGVNAAVVGILLGALHRPVWTSAVLGVTDFAIAAGGFLLLARWRLPPFVVVSGTVLAAVVAARLAA
jgi:chromate transporter